MLELVALTTDARAAADVARELGGTSYHPHPGEKGDGPYAGLVRVVTDRIEPLAAVADVGLYTVAARTIKAPAGPPPPERVVASFGLVHHPDLDHARSDAHWRDVHGPLALRCHAAMCDYTQLSILAVHHGLELDGIALCAFATRQDVSERFFNDDEARAEILADISSFADTRHSPRRVVLVEDPGADR